MKLQNIQKAFLDSVYRGDDSLQSVLSNHYPDLSINIYRNNAVYNLINALSIMYPAVYKILGEYKFNKVSKDYIKLNPSRDGNLDVYGVTFSCFLKEKKYIKDYICDLARLDLAYHDIYIAVDYCARPVDQFKHIASEDYEKVVFVINPALQLLVLEHDVLSMWGGEVVDVPLKSKGDIVMYRDSSSRICAVPLDAMEAGFIRQATLKKTFYEIFCDLAKSFPNGDIGRVINKMVTNNIVIDYYIAG